VHAYRRLIDDMCALAIDDDDGSDEARARPCKPANRCDIRHKIAKLARWSRNSQSRRCAAPMSDARRQIQLVSYLSVARSWTTSTPRRRRAARFSANTSWGRRTRTASATGSLEAGLRAADAFALAGVGDVRAREPGGDDVDRRDRRAVDSANVAEVVDAAEPVGENRSGVPVGLGVPGEGVAEDGVDGEVEAARIRCTPIRCAVTRSGVGSTAAVGGGHSRHHPQSYRRICGVDRRAVRSARLAASIPTTSKFTPREEELQRQHAQRARPEDADSVPGPDLRDLDRPQRATARLD
jgi:hypothetical protein